MMVKSCSHWSRFGEARRILSDIAKDEILVSRNVSVKVAVRNVDGVKVHTGELSFSSD